MEFCVPVVWIINNVCVCISVPISHQLIPYLNFSKGNKTFSLWINYKFGIVSIQIKIIPVVNARSKCIFHLLKAPFSKTEFEVCRKYKTPETEWSTEHNLNYLQKSTLRNRYCVDSINIGIQVVSHNGILLSNQSINL